MSIRRKPAILSSSALARLFVPRFIRLILRSAKTKLPQSNRRWNEQSSRGQYPLAASPPVASTRPASDEGDDLAFVQALFRTRHGHVARLKDGSALAEVEGNIERFGSLEEVRESLGDDQIWTETHDLGERQKFLASARAALQEEIRSLEGDASSPTASRGNSTTSIDGLENQHRSIQPFIRIFSVYSQFASTIAILAVPAFAILAVVRPQQIEILDLSVIVVVVPLAMTLFFLAASAVIGMLNIASAIFLILFVVAHVVGSAAMFGNVSLAFQSLVDGEGIAAQRSYGDCVYPGRHCSPGLFVRACVHCGDNNVDDVAERPSGPQAACWGCDGSWQDLEPVAQPASCLRVHHLKTSRHIDWFSGTDERAHLGGRWGVGDRGATQLSPRR